MHVEITSLTEILQQAEIEVSHTDLEPHFEKAYSDYRPKVDIKGFRKGKAPMVIIKRLFGEAIEHEALDTIATEFYHRAMTDQNIRPLGRPTMVDMDFKRGERFRFKIQYEVRPAIELHTYKGIAVEKPVHTVTDEEVEAELLRLRRANATAEEVTAVTDEDHAVTCDIQELDGAGTPLIGKKSRNIRFVLWDESLAPAIRDALRAAEVNMTYRASLENQHSDHTHLLHVAMTATKIERLPLPPFDDEFVKKVTREKVATTGEFTQNLRADLERHWNYQGERRVTDTLVSEIVRGHEFPVPESLVNGFLESFIEDLKNRSRDKQLPADFDEKAFRERNREHAFWLSKWMLLKERIAEVEHIGVTDDDLDRQAEADARAASMDKARLLDFYKKSEGVADRILTDKIIAFVKQHAGITERTVDEPALS